MGTWLASRISPRSALSSLPLLVVAALFALRVRPRDEIEMAIVFELQIVLLFPVMVGPILARPKSWIGQAVRWTLLIGVLVLFLGRGAYLQGGWLGIGTMLVLMLANYTGALVNRDQEPLRRLLLARWIIGFCAVFGSFVLSLLLLGAEQTAARDAWTGAICLLILAIAELLELDRIGAPAGARTSTDTPSEPRNEIVARRRRFAQRLRDFG